MTRPHRPSRVGWIDAGRGLAVLGMIVFHATWDLHYFGLSKIDPSASAGWQLFGHTVAGGFLFLSGLGLVLARQRGTTTYTALRRLAVLAAAAMSVTAATWLVMPDGVILFGILHCIALGNALALLVLEAPVAVLLGLAALAMLLPQVATGVLPSALWWVGLSTQVPISLDVRPLLPWIAPILFGTAASRSPFLSSLWACPGRWQSRPLAIAGRHSLPIYLLHQPVLMALLSVATIVVGDSSRNPASTGIDADTFLRQCETQCTATGTDATYCKSSCDCAMTAAKRSPSSAAEGLAISCSTGTPKLMPMTSSPAPQK